MSWCNFSLLRYVFQEFITYPVYINLSYLWNFGVLSFFCLLMQMMTGLFLAMFYSATSDAFFMVEQIMRNINFGWCLRYIHANGASFFFLCVYIHIFRNLYYNSFIKPRIFVWLVGMFILLLMMMTAFLGYVLPWGQMSFWAATVITSLFSAMPMIGEYIVLWLWGGYSVDQMTLNRFYSLHYLLPFLIFACVLLHVLMLHEEGSTNVLGMFLKHDKMPFHPYYTYKDLFSIHFFLMLFTFVVFFKPNMLLHTDNYILANPLVTPAHIVPEWYFLPLYAILRSMPNKLGGIFMLISALFCFFLLPYFTYHYLRNTCFRHNHIFCFWMFFLICIFLGWLGGKPMEAPFLFLGQMTTFFYFFLLLLFTCIHYYDYYNFSSVVIIYV